MSGRVRLGELLVTAHILSREQLEKVLTRQRTDGRRLGKLLVEQGLVTETQLTQILSQQLAVPWVSLYHIDFSRQLLDLVPQELAEKHCLIPIFVRRVRGLGETLYVAMDDPTDENAQRAVGEFSGLPVRTMIAPPSDIRSAIRAYYSGLDSAAPPPDGEPYVDEVMPAQPSEAPPAEAPAAKPPLAAAPPPQAVAPHARPTPAATPQAKAPLSKAPPDASPFPPKEASSAPTIEAREVSMPAPRRRSRRMVTLTLLDGTRVNLPARSSRPPAGDKTGDETAPLTARDLVAALRAVTHGADASEILGEKARWEPLFAALLELLLKKHLVADWEFVEEFKKI